METKLGGHEKRATTKISYYAQTHADKYTWTSLISLVHCMVNTMRSVPVMREPRAVLITCSGSEDLCQSLRAHFIQPNNPPLIYQFISPSPLLPLHRNSSSWSILEVSLTFFPSIFCCLISSFPPLPCINLLIYVNPFAVRMKLV